MVFDHAWMSRSSNVDAFSPGRNWGEMLVQDLPLLVVRRTVPRVPDIQAVEAEMGDRPRNWRVVFVGVRVQDRREWVVFVV